MIRNWLIRTKSNRIIGPLSKEKVIGYYQAGKLHLEDEITQGNGFWLKVSEEELVRKYLLKAEEQSFNPISEAEDVLTVSNIVEKFPHSRSQNLEQLPTDEDLEYPDIESTNPDIEIQEALDQLAAKGEDVTQMININDLKLETRQSLEESTNPTINREQLERNDEEKFEESTSVVELPSKATSPTIELPAEKRGHGANADDDEGTLPDERELEYPKVDSNNESDEDEDDSGPIISTIKPSRDKTNPNLKIKTKPAKPPVGQKTRTAKIRVKRRAESYFYLILLISVAVIMAVFYFYKMLFRKPLLSSLFISSVYAKVEEHPIKKKTFYLK